MRKNLGVKPYLYPQLVLIVGTYDENGNPNAMNAAWGGMADYNKIMVCMSSHKTTQNIDITKEFTVSIGVASQVIGCDYVGIVSQNNEPEKMKKSGFTTAKAEYINAPIINELPLCLECKVVSIVEDDLYIGEIINVNADESIIDKEGKISLDSFEPIVYLPSTHSYHKVGEKVGNAFSDGNILK